MGELDVIKKISESAKELGTLEASAIWALFCLVLIINIWLDKKHQRRKDEAWQKIRLDEAVADAKSSDALQKLADKLTELTIIVSERIPRR